MTVFVAGATGAVGTHLVPRLVAAGHEVTGMTRLFAGDVGAVMVTELRGARDAKAKSKLQWHPAHPSWRQGSAAA